LTAAVGRWAKCLLQGHAELGDLACILDFAQRGEGLCDAQNSWDSLYCWGDTGRENSRLRFSLNETRLSQHTGGDCLYNPKLILFLTMDLTRIQDYPTYCSSCYVLT
jgi:hypothetical protein